MVQKIYARRTWRPPQVSRFTGRFVVNPFSGESVPPWVANFVLAEYGTGAVMAVPAHDERDFEFAQKYQLLLRVVIQPDGTAPLQADRLTEASTELGRLVNSGLFTGLTSGTSHREDERRGYRERLRRGADNVSPEGLGRLPAALLGHADSGDLLPGLRRGGGAR